MADILVVDDQAINRELIVTLLGYKGHRSFEARDGAEALALVRSARPDLVICDILMPTMDGFEFVRQLRTDPAIASTEVIFYTAYYREQEARNLARSCGVAHVLVKPCEPDEILRVIGVALAHEAEPAAPGPPADFDREHLRLLTDQLSDKADKLLYANQRLSALSELNLRLASERDPHTLLDKVCHAARDLVGAGYAVLGVRPKHNGTKHYFTTAGIDTATVDRLGPPTLDGGMLGQVLADVRARRLRNPGGAPEAIGLPAGYPPAHSALACPIVSLEAVYGWLCLVNKLGADEFSDEDERLVAIHAAQMGRIYENGSLYAQVKEHAAELLVSETRFRQLAENIRDVFFLVDPAATQMLYVSPAYEAVWGRSRESLYADPRSWIDAVHDDDRPRAVASFADMAAAGKLEFQYRIVRPDGSLRWVRARGYPIQDETGTVYRVAGIVEDLTDEVAMQTALREREAGLRHAQKMARIAHVITRPDGSFESWSENLPQLIGVAPGEMPAMTRQWLGLVHPDDRALFRATALEAATTGRSKDIEYRIRHAGSGWIDIWQVIDPMRDQVDRDGRMRWFSTLQDVTQQRRAEKELRESERRFSDMLGKVQLISLMLDRDARITYCNDYLLRLTGWQRDEVLGRDWYDHFIPPGLPEVRGAFSALLDDLPSAWHVENEILTRSGDRRLVRWNNSVLRATSGEVIGTASIGEDITLRQQQEEKIRRLNRVHAVLSGINSTIVRVRSRDELFREACRIAVDDGQFPLAWIGGVDRAAQCLRPVAWHGSGEDILDLLPLGLDPAVADAYGYAGQVVAANEARVFDDLGGHNRAALGAQAASRGLRSMAMFPLETTLGVEAVLTLYMAESGLFDEDEMKLLRELAGDIAFAMGNIARQEKLDYLALYDQLTGLPNRSMFHERLAQDVRDAAAENGQLAVILLDIERFNHINDTFGRHAGDNLLKQIAERFLESAPNAERFARLAGDQFAVSITGVRNADSVARLLEKRIDDIFGPSFGVAGVELRLVAKFGIALFPGDGADAESLLRNAEAALKRAKATGDRYLFYTQQMTERVAGRLALENELRHGLERNEFILHYQPKVAVDTRQITGIEALMRWQAPGRNLMPPLRFIPLLEETGMILDVGAWALHQAKRDCERWVALGLDAPRIAVNVSAVQLRHRDFVATMRDAVAGGARPAAIDIEITESVLMEDIEANVAKLRAIRDLGVNIAIDDFGTGYSSLAYLARLPVHALKIDRSFIDTMVGEPDAMTLVSTIISLAHSLRLKVIAEGVETEDQARILRLLRCDEMQGYLISKPVPESEIVSMLQPAVR